MVNLFQRKTATSTLKAHYILKRNEIIETTGLV